MKRAFAVYQIGYQSRTLISRHFDFESAQIAAKAEAKFHPMTRYEIHKLIPQHQK
jgi:hypothetical protein